MKTKIITAANVTTIAAVVMTASADPVEIFPGVIIDRDARTVEFIGEVPIQADAGDGTVAFLEVIVCTPDTKEHEALVVTEARPSHVHAALLALGLEPGSPGGWQQFGDSVRGFPADGPPVTVEFIVTRDGNTSIEPAASWVKRDQAQVWLDNDPWLFSGSVMIDRGSGEAYDADGTGLLIGLTTFGTETLSYPALYSHDSAIEEPIWIADPDRTPPLGSPVTVRLTALGPPE